MDTATIPTATLTMWVVAPRQDIGVAHLGPGGVLENAKVDRRRRLISHPDRVRGIGTGSHVTVLAPGGTLDDYSASMIEALMHAEDFGAVVEYVSC